MNSLWFSFFVEGSDFVRGEGGVEDGELVDGAVEVADGELWIVAHGLAPVPDGSGADFHGLDAVFFGEDFLVERFAVEVVGDRSG